LGAALNDPLSTGTGSVDNRFALEIDSEDLERRVSEVEPIGGSASNLITHTDLAYAGLA